MEVQTEPKRMIKKHFRGYWKSPSNEEFASPTLPIFLSTSLSRSFPPNLWKSLSHVRLFATCGLYSPRNSLGQNTGVGSLSVLQGILPTQGSNSGLLHCEWILYQLSHKGSPGILEWVASPFCSGSSWPRNRTGSPAWFSFYNSLLITGYLRILKIRSTHTFNLYWILSRSFLKSWVFHLKNTNIKKKKKKMAKLPSCPTVSLTFLLKVYLGTAY